MAYKTNAVLRAEIATLKEALVCEEAEREAAEEFSVERAETIIKLQDQINKQAAELDTARSALGEKTSANYTLNQANENLVERIKSLENDLRTAQQSRTKLENVMRAMTKEL